MTQTGIFEAEPLARILDNHSGETIGWIYRWNTGDLAVFWMREPNSNSVLAPKFATNTELTGALRKALSDIGIC